MASMTELGDPSGRVHSGSRPGNADRRMTRSRGVRQPEVGTLADQFDELAENWTEYRTRNRYYHGTENLLFRTYIRPGAAVLELGCATGDLLASVRPAYGVGVDLSPRMLSRHGETRT